MERVKSEILFLLQEGGFLFCFHLLLFLVVVVVVSVCCHVAGRLLGLTTGLQDADGRERGKEKRPQRIDIKVSECARRISH